MKILKNLLQEIQVPLPKFPNGETPLLCETNEEVFFQEFVPKRFRYAALDLLDKQPSSLIEFGKRWAENPHSLYIYGSPGNGKTHFCFALVREFFRKTKNKVWARYHTSPNLDTLLHAEILNGSDSFFITNISKVELLFIDDFGRETKSERIKRQYFEILNNRYSNQLITILTSNFDLEYIEKELGAAISSRIQESEVIRFTAEDFRRPPLIF